MKTYLKRRYLPYNYMCEMQKRFGILGQKTVEEYFDEFELLRNMLDLENYAGIFMAQFINGLQERIARKVERPPYENLHEIMHLAIQVDQLIKRKVATSHISRPTIPYTQAN